jgi:hypothetical protein
MDACKDVAGSLLAIPEEIRRSRYLTAHLDIDSIPILPWVFSRTGVP